MIESGPPPLFNQGIPARARLAFFALLAVALLVVDARLAVLEKIRVGVGVVLYPVQRAVLAPVEAAGAASEAFTSMAALRRDNEALRSEAVQRAQQLQQARQLEVENERLRKLLGARERLGHPAVLGEVLYETRDRYTRRIVLDKGSNDGLRSGQPVLDDIGVVGQVTRVFPHTAEVTLVTDRDQTLAVQVLRTGLRAVAYGGAQAGTIDLRFLASNADLTPGDLVTTSGLDGVYPPGLAVGTVERIERNERDGFGRVVLRPAAGVHANLQLLVLQVDPERSLRVASEGPGAEAPRGPAPSPTATAGRSAPTKRAGVVP